MVINMVRNASCHEGFLNRETKEAGSVTGPELAMAEVSWTGEETKVFNKELLVECARDVLHLTNIQSQVQVKAILAQDQLK